MTVTFLGLGRMGRILAGHLVDDGRELLVWNRTSSVADDFVREGVRVASDVAEAVTEAPVVISAFFGPDAVRETLVEADLPWSRGALWIDITTVGPDDARSVAQWAERAGVRYVHSPVVGTLLPARNRALGVLLGGAAGDVAEARTFVEAWADPGRLRTFDTPAQAATAKLIANLGLAVSMQGLVEALRLGASEGIDADGVLAALDKTALGTISGLKADFVRADDYSDTQFSAGLLAKDAALMLAASDVDLPATRAALSSLHEAVQAGLGDEDFSVIARPGGGTSR